MKLVQKAKKEFCCRVSVNAKNNEDAIESVTDTLLELEVKAKDIYVMKDHSNMSRDGKTCTSYFVYLKTKEDVSAKFDQGKLSISFYDQSPLSKKNTSDSFSKGHLGAGLRG